MQKLLHSYGKVVRMIAALVAMQVVFTSLATSANTFPDLPNCPQRSALHGDATADAGTTPVALPDKPCCSACRLCSQYFNAHLVALNTGAVFAIAHAPPSVIPAAEPSVAEYIDTPIPPPPQPASLHFQFDA